MNEQELRDMMYTAQKNLPGPFVIRYPRGRGVMRDWQTPFSEMKIGKGQLIKEGNKLAIISLGHPGNFVTEALSKIEDKDLVAHYNLRFLKPIDEELLHQVCSRFETIITVEDGTIKGGMGSAVVEFINNNDYSTNVITLGVDDYFVEQGSPEELYRECGFDSDAIADVVRKALKVKS